ncbi:MAG: universal stress protein [Flavobacteriaceae bacterium]
MKNILVSTDFSNNAYNALFFATQLFEKRSCNFYLINTYTELTPLITQKIGAEGRQSLMAQLSDESAEGLSQVYHRIHLDRDNPLHHFKTISKNDHLIDGLNQAVDTYDIDLLVMGNKGQTSAKNILWGSRVSKAIDEVFNCPILIVPREIEYAMPKEIAFATDYIHVYNAKVLHPLVQLASLCEANIRILHINEEDRLSDDQKSNLYTLREYLGNLEHSLHWMPDFASKSHVIQTFLDELGIDMLVMLRYEHGFISSLIREPVLRKMSFNINIPLLVLPYNT